MDLSGVISRALLQEYGKFSLMIDRLSKKAPWRYFTFSCTYVYILDLILSFRIYRYHCSKILVLSRMEQKAESQFLDDAT